MTSLYIVVVKFVSSAFSAVYVYFPAPITSTSPYKEPERFKKHFLEVTTHTYTYTH